MGVGRGRGRQKRGAGEKWTQREQESQREYVKKGKRGVGVGIEEEEDYDGDNVDIRDDQSCDDDWVHTQIERSISVPQHTNGIQTMLLVQHSNCDIKASITKTIIIGILFECNHNIKGDI